MEFSLCTILAVRPDRKVEVINFENTKNQKYKWPTKEDIFPPEGVGEVQVSNHGEVDVFNISASLKFQIGSEKEQEGIVGASFDLPLIPRLKVADTPALFYLVNQSSYPVVIELPDSALVQVRGEKDRQQIAIVKRTITLLFDKVPLLPDSSHKWEGDRIVNPGSL